MAFASLDRIMDRHAWHRSFVRRKNKKIKGEYGHVPTLYEKRKEKSIHTNYKERSKSIASDLDWCNDWKPVIVLSQTKAHHSPCIFRLRKENKK
jgi:hypothetical protein